jgi:quercetin dioxygenase-like cupin family protein
MKKILLSLVLVVSLTALSMAQETPKPQTTPASTHVQMTPAQLKWGDPPPGLPKGARLAVLSGDPGVAGPFTVRLKFPAGYKVAPHWHATDEHVTVLSGTMFLGMGEKYNRAEMKTMPVGSYVLLPAEMRHYARTGTGATIQIHGNGPFTITYVNPEDDPRMAK